MIARLATWALQKLAVAAAIVVLALAAYGGWLYLQEEGLLERQRLERLKQAVADRDKLRATQAAVEQRIATLKQELEAQRARAQKAGEIVAKLRQLESWWDRLFGDREQQATNVERMQRLEAMRSEAQAKLSELQGLVVKSGWEKDGVDVALVRAEAEVARLEAGQSQARRYVAEAWESTKWFVAAALTSYLLGPTIWKLAMYFGVAPILGGGSPIRLGGEPLALPEVSESRVSLEAKLGPGELLRVKEKFLQASDEGVAKRTRFVLDWRIPFTSAACGLVELVELRHPGAVALPVAPSSPLATPAPEQPGAAVTSAVSTASRYHVTLSNGDDPHLELALVEVPVGASLVLRPSFLAGVVQREGEALEIRRHWRIFRWQAWISGQFRFFEFVGPCRLIVAGSRGVRSERLAEREGQPLPARRTNQDATIGFTPNLDYRPVRAETFWSYYRGMNALFDDLFAGKGLFVVQETSTEGSAARAGRFWSSVWSGILKVFGL
jgi:hypothetical protein